MNVQQTSLVIVLLAAGAAPLAAPACRLFNVEPLVGASDTGPVTIHRMGGDIDVAQAPGGATLKTMGGNIHLGSVGGEASVKTMGGDIAIDYASGSIDAVTMGGKITLTSENGSIKASTMGGDITAHVVKSPAGKHDIELSSKAGTIVLTVPKDFPMDVQVTLAYTKKAGDHYRIINHLGLNQQETQDWDNSHGDPRKYIRASGKVGSGLNHVTIETVNGDVILKQE